MRLPRKASLVLAALVVGVLVSFPACAQTFATPGGFSGRDFGSMAPTASGYLEAPWHDFASLAAVPYFRPYGPLPGSALGMNPLLPWSASASTALGISPLLVADFTHAAFPWSAPAWNDDLRLWINGLGGGVLGRPDEGVTAFSDGPLYANVTLGWPAGDGLHLGQR